MEEEMGRLEVLRERQDEILGSGLVEYGCSRA